MGRLRRLLERFLQSDEERLSREIRDWAESVPGTRRIADCPPREPVHVTGVVRRITLRPRNGALTLEAVVSDGTGEMTAAWIGRDHIEGLHLGTRVVLRGVLAPQRYGKPKMVNPEFDFA